jgi:hypothetical protein
MRSDNTFRSRLGKLILIAGLLGSGVARADQATFNVNASEGIAFFMKQLSSCQVELAVVVSLIAGGFTSDTTLSYQIVILDDIIADECTGQPISGTVALSEKVSGTAFGQTLSECMDLLGPAACPNFSLLGRTIMGTTSMTTGTQDASGAVTYGGGAQLNVHFTPAGAPMVWDSVFAQRAQLLLREAGSSASPNSAVHQHLASALDGYLRESIYLAPSSVRGTAVLNGTDELSRSWDQSLGLITIQQLSGSYDPTSTQLDPSIQDAINAINTDGYNAVQAFEASQPWLPVSFALVSALGIGQL